MAIALEDAFQNQGFPELVSILLLDQGTGVVFLHIERASVCTFVF